MRQVLKNLISSEKAVAVGLLVVAASVLAALGQMSIEQWTSYTKWLAGIYVSGKAIQGAADSYGKHRAEAARAGLEAMRSQVRDNDRRATEAAGELP